MRSTRGARGRLVVAGLMIGLVGLVSACSGSDTLSGAGGGAAESREEAGMPAEGTVDEAPAAPGPAGSGGDSSEGARSGELNRPQVQTRAVIRRGEISIVTSEMNRARTEIDDLLAKYGGYLSSEDTTNDRRGRPERSVLVLRVPEPMFDTVMTDLAEVGRTTQAERSSEDVTSQVIDVDSRVATQQASLARLQRFLRQATNVEDMIRLESEITERQATLESLKAQQKYLRDHTALSTVTVRLRTPAAPPPPPPGKEAGFLVGLAEGWDALRWVLVAGATVVGAVLPFLVTVGLVAVPVWLVARRRRPALQKPPPPAPDPT